MYFHKFLRMVFHTLFRKLPAGLVGFEDELELVWLEEYKYMK